MGFFLCRPSQVLHLFPIGCKIGYQYFFKFAPAGKNLREVEYYVSQVVTVWTKYFTLRALYVQCAVHLAELVFVLILQELTFSAWEDRPTASAWLRCSLWCVVTGDHPNGSCNGTFPIPKVELSIWAAVSGRAGGSSTTFSKWEWKPFQYWVC